MTSHHSTLESDARGLDVKKKDVINGCLKERCSIQTDLNVQPKSKSDLNVLLQESPRGDMQMSSSVSTGSGSNNYEKTSSYVEISYARTWLLGSSGIL